ncbi:class I tRNA ligase family protein [Candidatus Peregrinibacteria bacterium]|nr:class I tRNA ligase family protein [Candidatus Peregrinibacteria bacterium]
MFDPVNPNQRLPELEEGILQYWREEDIFKRSVHQRRAAFDDPLMGRAGREGSTFTFYDGPPFATGLPHYGHLLAGTIKDVIPRYHTMRGKYIERRFGWDCHGLPIENLIEKEHNIQNKRAIEEMGIDTFNALCRSAVLRYTKDWRTVVERMGRWVDMDFDYRTMDPDYMESMWWAFAKLWDKKLIYEGHKPMHICPRCVTPLSNFEVTQGYKDITDQSVTVKFALTDKSDTYLLAWTTTPWTLPGNLFLAVGQDIEYVQFQIHGDDATYIASASFVEHLKQETRNIKRIKTDSLLRLTYHPLFPYFADEYKNAFRVVAGDFVTTDEGTGIVHIAPGFGEDDFEIWEKETTAPLPNPPPRGEGTMLLQHVTMEGKFTDQVKDFAGLDVKPKNDPSKTDKKIAGWLEKNGKLFAQESYRHSYPHCWRCDSPLLNYATSSWFVSVEKIKDKMLLNNEKTSWVPSHIRDGRFGKWLENARDWAISRNRYWGTPIPIWKQKETIEVIGSRDDLMQHCKMRFTKVTAVRHGESKGNIIPIYQGQVPGTDLTDRGKEQAKAAGIFLKNQNVARIFCSPLARTQQTARIIAKITGAEIVVDERLREVFFGDYEGKTIDFSDLKIVKERRAKKLEDRRPESVYHFAGMESWAEVQKRVEEFLQEILPHHRSNHIVIVTHADPIQSTRHFFTHEDPIKLSHQPYPTYATPETFYWDHHAEAQMDLHNDRVDDVLWQGSHDPSSVDLTIVRHGETDWNKEERSQGWTDTPLNATGKRQVLACAKKLKKKKFDFILSSDLTRAIQTAEILAKELNVPHIGSWEMVRERNTGDWNGKKVDQILKEHPGISEAVRSTTLHPETPPNGESLSQLFARALHACERILKEFPGKRVLLVSHSGMTRTLQAIIENLTYREAATFEPKNGEAIFLTLNPFFRRIPEILDCWFESGSMPYAQQHFPFEMKHTTTIPNGFPADFIAEGVDQTRTWFYTLMILSTALFNETPFKNVVVNGIVLAEDGKKMSKRLKNYPDPMEVVSRHGADAVRFALMRSPAVRAEDLRFSEHLVEETVRSVLLPLWNAYSFFVTYANACHFEPAEMRHASSHPLDQWIHAEIQSLVNRMTKELDGYDLSATCSELFETIDALTNWYIRLSRRRFAGKDTPEERLAALQTLYDTLLTFSQLLAPLCPFITEAIYLNLVPEDHGSVHLTDWPSSRELTPHQHALIQKNRLMRIIVSLGNTVRAAANVKLRQPLQKAIIAVPPSDILLSEQDRALLLAELNVKELAFTDTPHQLADVIMQVDARKVGPRLGPRVQDIIAAGKRGEFSIAKDGSIRILDEVLTPAEASISYRGKEGRNIAAHHGIVVCIDTFISQQLNNEGLIRDLIRLIQRLRKEAGLSLADHITLSTKGAEDILKEFIDLILRETNATLGKNNGTIYTETIGDHTVVIQFTKT